MSRRRHDLRNCAVACSTCFCAPDRFLEMPTTGAEMFKITWITCLIFFVCEPLSYYLNLPLGPSDQVVLRFNTFKFTCIVWSFFLNLCNTSVILQVILNELFKSQLFTAVFEGTKSRNCWSFLVRTDCALRMTVRRSASEPNFSVS